MDHVADRLYDCVVNIPWFMRLEIGMPPGAPTIEVVVLYQVLVIATARLDKPKPLCFLHAKCFIYSSLPANPQRTGASLGWLQLLLCGSAFELRWWWWVDRRYLCGWECGSVNEISSGVSGIMKLPSWIWNCPRSEGYDSHWESLELFDSFNCLLLNPSWMGVYCLDIV